MLARPAVQVMTFYTHVYYTLYSLHLWETGHLASLHTCLGSFLPWLLDNTIRSKLSCAGPFAIIMEIV